MTYTTASEGESFIEIGGLAGRRMIRRAPTRVPGGTCHAVEEQASATLCGRPVADLHHFPDKEWVAFRRGCRECLAIIESAGR